MLLRQIVVFLTGMLLLGCGRSVLIEGAASDGVGGAGAGSPADPGSGSTKAVSSNGSTGSGAGSETTSGGMQSGTGNSTGTGTGSGGGESTICLSFGDPCTDCVSQICPDVWCGCAENQSCTELFTCFGNCFGDESCFQTCMQNYEDGISDMMLVNGCAGTACDSSCSWGDEEFDECDECLYEDCATQMNACWTKPSCGQLFQCFQGCAPVELSCHQNCYQQFSDGVPELEALFQCSTNLCATECEDE